MPNAALTIVHDDISRDVVVSVFAEGYIIKDTEGEEGGGEGHTYGYKLEQSTSQESVMSLEALVDGEDSVTLDHCSMFIDASRHVRLGAGSKPAAHVAVRKKKFF